MRASSRTVVAAALTATLVAGLAGCTDEPKPRTMSPLPSTEKSSKSSARSSSASPSTGTPSPSATTGMSDEKQVRTLNADYIANYRAAQDLPRDQRQDYLEQWMIPATAKDKATGITDQRKKHIRSNGTYVSHIVAVKIDEDSATVHDCVDQRSVQFVNDKTNKKIPGEYVDYFFAKQGLTHTTDGWRISTTEDLKTECTPPA